MSFLRKAARWLLELSLEFVKSLAAIFIAIYFCYPAVFWWGVEGEWTPYILAGVLPSCITTLFQAWRREKKHQERRKLEIVREVMES